MINNTLRREIKPNIIIHDNDTCRPVFRTFHASSTYRWVVVVVVVVIYH